MKISCLGWGSLIWNPGTLPIEDWTPDGPPLPVEFARQSRNGRLTLVLLKEGERLPMLHALLKVATLDEAVAALATREGCAKRWIGYWAVADAGASGFLHAESIGRWASDKNLDAVVWTALPAKFGGVDDRVPTAAQALSYLGGLEGETRRIAEEYVRKAPRQIRTPYRRLIERELGWLPASR